MPSGRWKVNVTWLLDDNGTLTISGTGKLNDFGVFFGKAPWLKYAERIKKLIIEYGITCIEVHAFRCCENLKSIILPSSVIYTHCCFYGCTSLTNIIIHYGVKSIDDSTFSMCTSLATIDLPSSVTKIGKAAFRECKSLTEITIPSSVTEIGEKAFLECTSLSSIKIPASVKKVGSWIFYLCTKLKEIHYPAGRDFERILLEGNNARLIPYDVSKSAPPSVTNVTVQSVIKPTPQSQSVKEKLRWKIEGKTLTIDDIRGTEDYFSKEPPWKDYLESIEKIIIANGVEKISAHLFFGCLNVSEVVFPASLTSIGDGAFSGCTSLTSIKIPDSVTKIGLEVFSGCENLEKIYYPVASDFEYKLCAGNNAQIIAYTVDSQLVEKFWWKVEGKILTVGGVHEIGDYSSKGFPWKDYLDLVEKIVIVNGVKKIIAHAFADFPNVEEVAIPLSITDIGDCAFSISFCGDNMVNGGKNLFWCLEDGVLVIKKILP